MRTKQRLQEEIGVAYATIENWIKTGVITAPDLGHHYSEEQYKAILGKVNTATFDKLTQRANRNKNQKRVAKQENLKDESSKRYLDFVIRKHQALDSNYDTTLLAIVLNALHQNGFLHINEAEGTISSEHRHFTSFVNNWMAEQGLNLPILWQLFQSFKAHPFPFQEVDFLGIAYQSLRTISENAAQGAYFTPEHLLRGIETDQNVRVLDPCCGTGRILISLLSQHHDPEKVHGYDVDGLSVKLCKTNLHLHFNRLDFTPKIQHKDFIISNVQAENNAKPENCANPEYFGLIVTNPPWGAKFKTPQKQLLKNKRPNLNTSESFSHVLYNALAQLNKSGKLVFILPEAFLSVEAHQNIRKHVLNHYTIDTIELFGNAFKGVMSKTIRLTINKNKRNDEIKLVPKNKEATVNYINKRALNKAPYYIPLLTHPKDQVILSKVMAQRADCLAGQAQFGLGIVTGNNQQHLKESEELNHEPIFRGKDLHPFYFGDPKYFINFQPSILQQVAPPELYRQTKLCYRFIANQPIFALDQQGSLILNSANFCIPDSKYNYKTLVALFNSPLYTFIYQKLFNSTKVLRTHIENLPIPIIGASNSVQLQELHDLSQKNRKYQKALSDMVMDLFDLNHTDKEHILGSAFVNGHKNHKYF